MLVFRTVCHLPISWDRSIQSTSSKPIYFRSILVLSSHLWLGLASGHFPSGSTTEHKHTHLLSNIGATYMSHNSGTEGTLCGWSLSLTGKVFVMFCHPVPSCWTKARPEIKYLLLIHQSLPYFQRSEWQKQSLKHYKWQWLTAQVNDRKETL